MEFEYRVESSRWSQVFRVFVSNGSSDENVSVDPFGRWKTVLMGNGRSTPLLGTFLKGGLKKYFFLCIVSRDISRCAVGSWCFIQNDQFHALEMLFVNLGIRLDPL